MPAPSLTTWIKLLSVAVIWGSAFVAVTLALRDLSPLQVAAGRVTVGALALGSLAVLRGVTWPSLRNPRLWVYIISIAILSSALPFSLLSWGQSHVPSAFAGMSMACVPLFVLPLAHVFVPGDHMTPRKTIGFLIGFAGTVWLVAGGGIGASGSDVENMARLACLAAALCYAVGSVATRRCPPVDELALSAASLFIAMCLLIAAMLWIDGLPSAPSLRGAGALLYLGLIPTALAFVLKVSIIRSAGPSFMSLVNYMVPVWSVIAGALVLAEVLPPQLFYALGLILIGLAISQWPTLRRLIFRA